MEIDEQAMAIQSRFCVFCNFDTSRQVVSIVMHDNKICKLCWLTLLNMTADAWRSEKELEKERSRRESGNYEYKRDL